MTVYAVIHEGSLEGIFSSKEKAFEAISIYLQSGRDSFYICERRIDDVRKGEQLV